MSASFLSASSPTKLAISPIDMNVLINPASIAASTLVLKLRHYRSSRITTKMKNYMGYAHNSSSGYNGL
jgi:hypothetical protein